LGGLRKRRGLRRRRDSAKRQLCLERRKRPRENLKGKGSGGPGEICVGLIKGKNLQKENLKKKGLNQGAIAEGNSPKKRFRSGVRYGKRRELQGRRFWS